MQEQMLRGRIIQAMVVSVCGRAVTPSLESIMGNIKKEDVDECKSGRGYMSSSQGSLKNVLETFECYRKKISIHIFSGRDCVYLQHTTSVCPVRDLD